MKHFYKIILTVAVLTAATAISNAQPVHNDTLRTNTWSIYLQGGVSGFHDMKGGEEFQYNRDRRYAAPIGHIGVMFFPRPWIRFGLDLGYSYLKSVDLGPDVLTHSTETETVIDGHKFTRYLNEARIQNRNFTHVAFADLTYGINFIEIWRERRPQWFNFWVTVGAGYMRGWNKYTTTWAIDERCVCREPGLDIIYENSSVKSNSKNNSFDTFYVPAGVSMEFDVIPSLTLGLYGNYKYFPLSHDYIPLGMWSAGGLIRFNLGGSKFPTKNDQITSLKGDIAQYEKNLTEIREQITTLKETYIQVSEEKTRVESELAKCAETKKEPIKEVEKPLSHYAVQIMAFRQYQHKPDDAIFNGDNPVIYRAGKLRRYVIFTDTLEAALAKHKEVLSRYKDAFVVVIGDDGSVTKYE